VTMTFDGGEASLRAGPFRVVVTAYLGSCRLQVDASRNRISGVPRRPAIVASAFLIMLSV